MYGRDYRLMRSLAAKIFGEPPDREAPRVEQMRWVRGFYLKPLPLTLLACAFIVIYAPTPVLIAAGVGLTIWLQGLISLTLRIRREERGPS
jgi:hypothetical protein